MAILSAAGSVVAFSLSLAADEPPVTGLALGVLLALNALVRAQLARRG